MIRPLDDVNQARDQKPKT